MKIKDMTDDELRALIIESLHQDKPAPHPRTPRLVEAVSAYLEYLHDCSIPCKAGNERLASLRLALAAEKKRQELVDELKRVIRVWQNRGCNQSCVITAIDNLDAYEKGEAQ